MVPLVPKVFQKILRSVYYPEQTTVLARNFNVDDRWALSASIVMARSYKKPDDIYGTDAKDKTTLYT